MSYDVYLERDLCLNCSALPVPRDIDWNYTCNVAPMWREAMPETDGLAGMAGMITDDALPHLKAGIAAMEADPAKFIAMNPLNKWGDFHSQFEALRILAKYFADNPGARIVVSR